MSARAWTVAELAELRRRWISGATPEDIARALGRTPAAIKTRAAVLKLGPRLRRSHARFMSPWSGKPGRGNGKPGKLYA
jgi:hypothetical protein